MLVTKRYLFTVFLVAFGASFNFYSFGVVNPPQTIVEAWINRTYVQRNGRGFDQTAMTVFWSFTASSIAIGAFVGSLLTRMLAERLGRRNGIFANGAATCVGALLEMAARWLRSPELLVVGRFVLGANMGISSGLVPLYLTEITPVRYRGAAGTAHMIAVAFGDWFSLFLSLPFVLGSDSLWPLAFAFPGLPALLLCVFLPFSPESPRFLLISHGKRSQARKAIQYFCGDANVDRVFEELVREAALMPPNHHQMGIRDLFRHKSLRSPLLISTVVMVAQQFTGSPAVFAYSTQMFRQAGLAMATAQLATLGCGIAYFLSVLPSPYLIEKWGRRWLSLTQLSGCLVSLIALTVFVWLQDTYGWQWASYATIGALVVYMCLYGVGSPIPWLITSELFAQQHRSAAVAYSTFIAWLMAFLTSTAYLPFQQLVGPAFSFLPFIVILSVSIAAMASLLPETRNRSIDDIVRDFRSRARTVSRTFTMRDRLGDKASAPELARLLEEDESAPPSRQPSHGALNNDAHPTVVFAEGARTE